MKFNDAKFPEDTIEAVISEESHSDLVEVEIQGDGAECIYLTKENALALRECLIKLSKGIHLNNDIKMSGSINYKCEKAESALTRISSELAHDVMDAKEKIIKKALCHHLKMDDIHTEELEEIAGRANFKVYPSGVEIFEFDGVPLVEFQPMEAGQTHDGMNAALNAEFKFKELYCE
jgi:hypothetical protein